MSKDAAKDWDFTPYAQLVAALLPRAGGLSIFEPDGQLRWTSQETVAPVFEQLIQKSVAVARTTTEAGERTLAGRDEPVYLFWLRDDAGAVTAVFAVSWRGAGGAESDSRSFSYVHAMLKPVLEAVRRELVLRARISAAPAGASHSDSDDTDLQVLLTTADTERYEVAADGLHALLQNVNRHLQCEFAALVVPERNLVTVLKADGKNVDTSILARLHRHLLALAQVSNDAMVLNEPDSLPGAELPFRVLASSLRNPAGRVAGVLVLFRSRQAPAFRRRHGLLADLLARRAASIIDSSYDPLSGVFTRKAFEQRARPLLAKRAENKGMRWSCLYLDADRMHAMNDNYGMLLGDRLIAKLGELIRSRLVPGALAARISGDRFALLLPTGDEDAMQFAEALRVGVERLTAMHLGGTEDTSFKASVSIGVAALTDPRVDLAHALAVAETACKAAKDRGRNRVELYQASDVSLLRRYEDVNIAPGLRAALSEGRVRMDAQLIAPLPGSGCDKPHFELLLRMIDDKGDVVGPARFLSAAIRYQLMPEIDRWVIQEVLGQLAPLAPLLEAEPVVFTVNLSGQSLGEVNFADELISKIKASGVNPRVLCFELTESAAIANLGRAEDMMRRLRELGCTIALDDFGTGLSSLAYLRSLPVDMLKIDGSFVKDVLKDPRAESMVQAIAQLARSMHLTTVAEYVETDEIRLAVARLGVDYGQGFAISRPGPFTDVIRDLPTYASVAKQRAGGQVVLGADDETISAELQEELKRELEASGIQIPESEDDIQVRMERIIADYGHEAAETAGALEREPQKAAG
jgi:diguanylate cyclase (GGDEF)-like protein